MSGRNKQKFQLGQSYSYKLYSEESLVSSNLNSKRLRFHGAHPKLYIEVAQGAIFMEQNMRLGLILRGSRQF